MCLFKWHRFRNVSGQYGIITSYTFAKALCVWTRCALILPFLCFRMGILYILVLVFKFHMALLSVRMMFLIPRTHFPSKLVRRLSQCEYRFCSILCCFRCCYVLHRDVVFFVAIYICCSRGCVEYMPKSRF